jgi:Heme oxygenase
MHKMKHCTFCIAALFSILLVSYASCFQMSMPASLAVIKGKSKSTPSSLTMSKEIINQEITNPRKEGLALMLDDGTRKSHSVAQNSAFVTGFFKGLSSRDSYAKLLTSLYFVYMAMEEAFDITTEGMVKKMDSHELRRIQALSDDMEYFYGSEWKSKIFPSMATQKYVKRVREVAQNYPRLLIAHQYTRYLGDLFGGQMMGSMANKSLDLSYGKGTAFYTFEGIENTGDFINEWYRQLNELDLSDGEKEDIVNEANLVFDLNIDILNEIEGSPWKTITSLVWKSLKEKLSIS